MHFSKLCLWRNRPILSRLSSFLRIELFMKESESVKSLSRFWLFAMPWAVAHQTLLYIEFSRQEYWSGLPFPPPENLPDPRTGPMSSALQVVSLLLSQQGALWIHTQPLFWFLCHVISLFLNIMKRKLHNRYSFVSPCFAEYQPQLDSTQHSFHLTSHIGAVAFSYCGVFAPIRSY